jgi:hypothetical protein
MWFLSEGTAASYQGEIRLIDDLLDIDLCDFAPSEWRCYNITICLEL